MSLSTSAITTIAAVAAVAFLFGMGYGMGYADAKEKYKLEGAVALAEQGRINYAKSIQAADTLSKANADTRSFERKYLSVLHRLEHTSKRVSSTECRDEVASATACGSLLRGGADLVGRCAVLLREHAGIHDASVVQQDVSKE